MLGLRGIVSFRQSILLFVLFLAGAIIRIGALPLPGSPDLPIFGIWAYNAAASGPERVYGTGGWPPERPWLSFHGEIARAEYPVVAMDELALVGRLAGVSAPLERLTVGIKLLIGAFEIALTALLFWAVASLAGIEAGSWAALGYWLNPAVLLQGSALGYIEPFYALPAIAALVAASRGRAWLTGAPLAVGILTKPLGVLLLPATAFGLIHFNRTEWRRNVGVAVIAGCLVAAVCFWPLVRAGTLLNMLNAVGHRMGEDILSGNATNLWWLMTYGARVAQRDISTGVVAAMLQPVNRMDIREFLVALGLPGSKFLMAVFTICAWVSVWGAAAWALWRVRGDRGLIRLAAAGAFTVHAYTVLALQVHENHFYLALPLLSIVAAVRSAYRSLFVCLSALAALNLNLFYGVGSASGGAIPRTITGIDLTVLLALANCAALFWHSRAFCRESSLN